MSIREFTKLSPVEKNRVLEQLNLKLIGSDNRVLVFIKPPRTPGGGDAA